MSAIGINAANLSLQTMMFTSVSVTQVSVASDKSFDKLMTEKSADTGQPVKTNSTSEPVTDTAKAVSQTEQPTASDRDVQQNTPVSDKPGQVSAEADRTGDVTEPITDEELEEATEVIMTLIQQISVVLQITTVELQDSMKDLGITAADLFDKDSLAQLVLYSNNASDSTEFLVNPELLELYNKLNELVEEFTETMQIDPERIMKVLEDFDLSQLRLPTEITKPVENLEETEPQGDVYAAEELGTEPLFTVEHHEETDEGHQEEASDRGNNFSGIGREENAGTVRGKTSTVSENFNAFMDRLEGAVKNTEVSSMNELQGVSVRDIVYQLVDAIKVDIGPENTSLTMHLSPESLGKVSLNISSKNGVMTAQITTENQTAREAIESQLQILKENIESRGITVEAIEVTVSSFDFSDSRYAESKEEERSESRRSSRRGIEISDPADAAAVAAEAQRIEQEIMQENGSTVNYVA